MTSADREEVEKLIEMEEEWIRLHDPKPERIIITAIVCFGIGLVVVGWAAYGIWVAIH